MEGTSVLAGLVVVRVLTMDDVRRSCLVRFAADGNGWQVHLTVTH